MKYIYIVLILGVLWCNVGYGEGLSNAIRELTEVQFQCLKASHDSTIKYTDDKFITLYQLIIELKAEVEELREKKLCKCVQGDVLNFRTLDTDAENN